MDPHKKQAPLKTSPLKKEKEKEKKSGAVFWGDPPRQDTLSGLPLFRGAKLDAGHALRFSLRRLKSKDLAFIMAGFSVLVMAPLLQLVLASHEEATQLSQGFDRKGIEIGGLGSLFENGVFGIAPGGLVGGADVISPLSGRDPTELVLGYRLEDGAPKASPVSETAPEPGKRDGWREAASAARRGATQAARRAGPPRPSARLAGKLSGFSTGSGGSSSSVLALPAPASRGLLSRVYAESHMKPVRTLPEYRGLNHGSGGPGAPYLDPKKVVSAASGGGANADARAMDSSRGAGGASSGGISGPGPDAEKQANVGVQDNRNIQPKEQKESLAHMAKKMNMEQAIKLKWDKKRYNQIERKKMAEQTMMQTASQAFLKILDKLLEGGGGGGGGDGGGGGGNSSSGGGGGEPQGKQVETPEGGMGVGPDGQKNFARNGWAYKNGRLQIKEFGTGKLVDAPKDVEQLLKQLNLKAGDAFLSGKSLVNKEGNPIQSKTASGPPQGKT